MGVGGNKLRKYERIIADALAKNSDTLIIAGHRQSNAARVLVEVARAKGLEVVVICKPLIPSQNEKFSHSGNALLMTLMNTQFVDIDMDVDFFQAMNEIAQKLSSKGKVPYIIPFGGSNLLGSLGYFDCAFEIISQFNKENQGIIHHLVTPMGSGGTQAGLVAGFALASPETNIQGISVLQDKQSGQKTVESLVSDIFNYLGKEETSFSTLVRDNYIGGGYGIVTTEAIAAIKLVAQLEGIFLCPVYSGKAMAGLIDLIENNEIKQDENLVFLHTGGGPLVHAYYDKFIKDA